MLILSRCRAVLLTLSLVFIAACGGGGSDGGGGSASTPPPPQNSAPTVDAGVDQSVDEGATVSLQGAASDSDGSIASYAWSQAGGTAVTLSNAGSASTEFVAPDVKPDETLTFQLTVTDDDGATSSDSVVVTVRHINQSPTASAGSEQNAESATSVTLAGSASDSDGEIASYAWSQLSGTPVTLSQGDTATATFEAPDVSSDELLEFELLVTDDEGAQASSFARVYVLPIVTELPIKTVVIEAPALQNSSLDLSTITALTVNSAQPLLSNGSGTADFAEGPVHQLLFLVANEQPVGVVFVDADAVASGNLQITADNMLAGLLVAMPYMHAFDKTGRDIIVREARQLSAYADLVADFEAIIAVDHQNLLNGDKYPSVYEHAATLLQTTVASLQENSATSSAKLAAKATSNFSFAAVGTEEEEFSLGADFTVKDQPAATVLFRNPKMVFYGIEVDGAYQRLLYPKEDIFSILGFGVTPPAETQLALGDGEFDVQFYIAPGATDPRTFSSTFAANVSRAACILIDTIYTCPVSARMIGIAIDNGQDLSGLGALGDTIGNSLPDIFSNLVGKIKANITLILSVLQLEAFVSGVNVDDALKNLALIAKYATGIKTAITAYKTITETAPFLLDYRYSPRNVGACLTQDGEDLFKVCSDTDPAASFTVVDGSLNRATNETLTFDASGSEDVAFPLENLEFRWDFDSDGIFETEWLATSVYNYQYSEIGVYQVTLEVRNPRGRIGTTIAGVEIVDPINLTEKIAFSNTTTTNEECADATLGWSYTFTDTTMTLTGTDTFNSETGGCIAGPGETFSLNMTNLANDFDIPFNCKSYPICTYADLNKTITGIDADGDYFVSTYAFNYDTDQLVYTKSAETSTFREVITLKASDFSIDLTEKAASSAITDLRCPFVPLGWSYTFNGTTMTLSGTDTILFDGETQECLGAGPPESITLNMPLASNFDVPFNCASYPICTVGDFNKVISGIDGDNRSFTSTYVFNVVTNVLVYMKQVSEYVPEEDAFSNYYFREVITLENK